MTNPPPPAANNSRGSPSTAATNRNARLVARLWSSAQLLIALGLTLAVLIYLVFVPLGGASHGGRRKVPAPVVQAVSSNVIRIDPSSKLAEKLQVVTVETTSLTSPILPVTGTVVASLRVGKDKGADYWQFNSPETLTAYTDWQKSIADTAFNESQLVRIKQLAETRLKAQQRVVDRAQKLVDAGTESVKNLAAEQTSLLQFEIQGAKEVYEAETTVRTSQRAQAALSRQLQQSGLDPALLLSATADEDIVLADVPEGAVSMVSVGEACEAKFFGLPGEVFSGKINSISPVLSKERRSLRVLLIVHDPQDKLRPGMFAEVGLGTDAREAILVPAAGTIHIAKTDYVLVADKTAGDWRITPVRVGEPQQGLVEILAGLKTGQRLVGQGAILLKPAVGKALLMDPTPPAPTTAERR